MLNVVYYIYLYTYVFFAVHLCIFLRCEAMKRQATTEVHTVSVSMLGGFSLQMEGRTLTDESNRSRKLWSVLAYLILHRDRAVPQAELIDQFWPEEDRANPTNALKTLLFRLRAQLVPLFGEEISPILSRRGGYLWNPSITCLTDTDRFEELCSQAGNIALSASERMELYRQAVALYQGDFLPRLNDQVWVVSLSAHYHARYLAAVKDYAALLERAEEYRQMQLLCLQASELEPLDEELHTLIIRAMLLQGDNAGALSHYEKSTDLLYRNLGVRPSEKLRKLYDSIMEEEKLLENDLDVIQGSLKEATDRPGAFVCAYGFFKEIYQLEVRRAARAGTCIHLALLTVSLANGAVPPLQTLNVVMDQLQEILLGSLRRGDVISKYSGAQYVVMLPGANFENSTMVMNRIVDRFYQRHRHSYLKISYKLRDLD